MDPRWSALSAPGLARRAMPFLGVLALAFAAMFVPGSGTEQADPVIAASLSSGLLIAAAAWVPWRRLPPLAEAVVPLGFVVVLLLLRESRGGAGSGFAPLAMVPVV